MFTRRRAVLGLPGAEEIWQGSEHLDSPRRTPIEGLAAHVGEVAPAAHPNHAAGK